MRVGMRPFADVPENLRDAMWDEFERMNDTVVVNADNVVRYFYEDCPKEAWKIGEDIPNVAPPLASMFVEARAPRWINMQGELLPWPSHTPRSWGALMFAIDYAEDEQDWEEKARRNYEAIFEWINSNEEWIGDGPGNVLPRWIVHSHFFVEFERNKPFGPLMNHYLLVAPDGQPIKTRLGHTMEFAFPFSANAEEREFLAREGGKLQKPLQLAVSFMHCKNVARIVQTPPVRAATRHARKYGRPLTKYYTLEIQPMKAILEREGKASEVGLKRALHICRGHFAVYSSDKPLFGKYAGTFWKPQHVRGSKEQGEVVKDYSVKAPE